jgi:RNA polymerase sigma-70 factor (ECF subfamily)
MSRPVKKNRGRMSEAQTERVETPALDLEELFREYYPRVYAYIRYRINDVAEAEDLTSEILERAFTHLSSYDARKGAFSTWLFRIAHNAFVNHLKKWQRRGRYHTTFPKEETLVAEEPTPEQAVLHAEQISDLVLSVQTLSSRQQEILSLRFAGRLTNREIARVLNMNERTVSVTILRALRKLRQQIKEKEF